MGSTVEFPHRHVRSIRPIKGSRQWDRFCAVHINDDSLICDKIYDGDYAIVRLTFDESELEPGKLIAARIPKGTLIRHYWPQADGTVKLKPANPDYCDLALEADEIIPEGIVVRIERDLAG